MDSISYPHVTVRLDIQQEPLAAALRELLPQLGPIRVMDENEHGDEEHTFITLQHNSDTQQLVMLTPEAKDTPQPSHALSLPCTLGELVEQLQPLILAHADVGRIALSEDIELDVSSRTIVAGAVHVSLTEKEMNLLMHLHFHPDQASKEEVLAAVWRYQPTLETGTLETHLYRLRKKLSEASLPLHIELSQGCVSLRME